MTNKDKSNIIDEYSKVQQGSLVGRGNEVLARADKIENKNEKYSDSLDPMPLEEAEHGEIYGSKEYHGI